MPSSVVVHRSRRPLCYGCIVFLVGACETGGGAKQPGHGGGTQGDDDLGATGAAPFGDGAGGVPRPSGGSPPNLGGSSGGGQPENLGGAITSAGSGGDGDPGGSTSGGSTSGGSNTGGSSVAGENTGGNGAGGSAAGGAGGSGSGGASTGGSNAGTGGAPPVSACTDFADRSGVDASRQIAWGFGITSSEERCILVAVGQEVVYAGNFGAHPIGPADGDTPNPFATLVQTTSTATVTFVSPGTYDFECGNHATMWGAVRAIEP